MCATSVEGEWSKLAATDYDFKVNTSTSGAPFRGWVGVTSHTVFLLDGKFEVYGVGGDKFFIFELSSRTDKITPLDFMPVILGLVLRGTGSGLYLHTTKASRFLYVAATPEAVARVVSFFVFGLMSDVHGSALKKHISCLVKVRIAAALDAAPDVVMEWQASLLLIKEDTFLQLGCSR